VHHTIIEAIEHAGPIAGVERGVIAGQQVKGGGTVHNSSGQTAPTNPKRVLQQCEWAAYHDL
jgi:hypothetical protein